MRLHEHIYRAEQDGDKFAHELFVQLLQCYDDIRLEALQDRHTTTPWTK